FLDIEGDRKPAPRHPTRMKMLWDDQALYIAARLEEPHVWGTIGKHDAVIFHDPDFEVFLDPDGDGRLYAELELNAKNATWDLLLPKPYQSGGRAIDAWEIAGLETAVSIEGTLNEPADVDRAWTVEIRWPWKGLKELTARPSPPAVGDRWRINFSRVEWETRIEKGKYVKLPGKPEANWVWSPQGVVDMHRPERWGVVQFAKSAPPGAKVDPDPSLPARRRLYAAYYAQRDFHKRKGRFAKSLAELGQGGGDLRLESTAAGFLLIAPADGAGKGAELRLDHEGWFTRSN
ncbi:MAG TPA: carbohydrate-binding family 9-like protein, partial [Planctomycetia bacterium]|nr:carbohydrate-binding family 9-like protein [Planctomycetia bacterium]